MDPDGNEGFEAADPIWAVDFDAQQVDGSGGGIMNGIQLVGHSDGNLLTVPCLCQPLSGRSCLQRLHLEHELVVGDLLQELHEPREDTAR